MLRNRKLISIVSALSFLLISITAPAFSAIAKKALTAPKSISVAFLNDTTTNNVSVTWSPVANNSGYTVRIYKSPNVTKPFMTAQISQNTVTATFSLAYNSEYRVTVQTLGTGSFSNSRESGKYSFNTNFNAVITTQPAGAVNGDALTTQPQVRIAYPSGNTLTGFTGNVVATIASGTGTLSGTTTVAASSGIATFAGLTLTGTAGNFTLRFTPVGASAVTSASFALTAGAASTIAINAGNNQSATAGTAVTTAPSVIVKDSNNNPVSGVSVTFAVETGAGSLATSGTVSTGADGIATSPAWTLGTSAGSNTLSATSGSLSGSPLTFTATGTAGAADSAVITTQPSGAVNGVALTTQPVVKIVDANGNTVTGFTGNVVASIATGTGTLSGTTTVAASSGSATFTDLVITGTAGDFTLTFTPVDNTITPVTSNPFAVAPGASSSLITTGQFTIRFWVKPTTGFLDGGRKELVSLVTDDGVNRFDIWYSPNEGSDWGMYNNYTFFNSFTDISSTPPVIGNWYEVVVTRDATNKLHFYFDSIESTYQPESTVDLTTYKNILIGADPANWFNLSASGQGDAYISNLQIINGVALTPISDFANETARTTFWLKDYIGTNNSLVLTPSSYFAYSDGELTPRPTGGTPALSAESPVLAVGRTGPGGGKIFYYSAVGFACGPTLAETCHYLEAAPTTGTNPWTDAGYVWSGNETTEIGLNAQGVDIGTGYKNTEAMVDQSDTAGKAGTIARAYGGPFNSTDWYLPSKKELNELCKYARGLTTGNTAVLCSGTSLELRAGFELNSYWSSSEYVANDAWFQNFYGGYQVSDGKSTTRWVRPIRAFSGPSLPVCDGSGQRISGGSGACQVGDIGPGGGTIYYYEAAGFKCGNSFSITGSPTGGLCHYLEVAPNGWAPSDLHDWGNNPDQIDQGIRSPLTKDPHEYWSPDSVWQTGGGQPGFVTNAITTVGFTSTSATYILEGHAFRVGDYALISGLNPVGYNGVFTIASVTSDTFTVANTTNTAFVDGSGILKTNRKQIGAGRLNTLEMQTAGNNSDLKWAYNSVLQYSGSGQTDWYIPSVYELRELCKWAKGQTTGDTTAGCSNAGTISPSFIEGSYWSSNQSLQEDYRGVRLNFTNPSNSGVSGEVDYFYSTWSNFIRPVRAF